MLLGFCMKGIWKAKVFPFPPFQLFKNSGFSGGDGFWKVASEDWKFFKIALVNWGFRWFSGCYKRSVFLVRNLLRPQSAAWKNKFKKRSEMMQKYWLSHFRVFNKWLGSDLISISARVSGAKHGNEELIFILPFPKAKALCYPVSRGEWRIFKPPKWGFRLVHSSNALAKNNASFWKEFANSKHHVFPSTFRRFPPSQIDCSNRCEARIFFGGGHDGKPGGNSGQNLNKTRLSRNYGSCY